MFKKIYWLAAATIISIIRPKLIRKTNQVTDEYTAGWASFARYLDGCNTLDDWLQIKGVEDQPSYLNLNGYLAYTVFDSNNFNRKLLLETILHQFPNVSSITEFGCGLGRNLLYIKKHLPHVECYGYELCMPGVEIARAASEKFGVKVNYSQLDYVNADDSSYVYPLTDVAFTLYSLEQLPDSNKKAMENILRHTKFGSIHIEPVPENYPLTFRGIVGRLNHWKASYLRSFEQNLSTIDGIEISKKFINTSHSPLMFPTLYVIKK